MYWLFHLDPKRVLVYKKEPRRDFQWWQVKRLANLKYSYKSQQNCQAQPSQHSRYQPKAFQSTEVFPPEKLLNYRSEQWQSVAGSSKWRVMLPGWDWLWKPTALLLQGLTSIWSRKKAPVQWYYQQIKKTWWGINLKNLWPCQIEVVISLGVSNRPVD